MDVLMSLSGFCKGRNSTSLFEEWDMEIFSVL